MPLDGEVEGVAITKDALEDLYAELALAVGYSQR